MEPQPPSYPPTDARRARDAQDAFYEAARKLIVQAVHVGWRESEAAMALADAADEYVMFLAQKPTRDYLAANSN